MRLSLALAALPAASAFQLPFNLPLFFGHSQSTPDTQAHFALPETTTPQVPRIAIIGAGAAGSASAFWIAKARERFGLDVQVDIYERNDYIGGRSITVQPYDDPTLDTVELGASIFVTANKNLWRASDEFGLERVDFEDPDSVVGVWDGEEFVLTSGGGFYSGWWNTLKIIWRYGYEAPRKAEALTKSMINKFITIYGAGFARFTSINELASRLGWDSITAQTAAEYFDEQGVGRKWSREVIEAATRVNYAQNVDHIHALEGLCSLAAAGASGVKGGNWQIFEGFVKRSNATVHLNTTVTAITRSPSDTWVLYSTASPVPTVYTAVILAAPYHSTGIAFKPSFSASADFTSNSSSEIQVPPQPYIHLHVTLLSTTSPSPNASYFNLKKEGTAPTTILTTWEGVREGKDVKLEFNSLTYHGKVQTREGEVYRGKDGLGKEEWVVKIFSMEPVSDAWLANMFGHVGWIVRKEWDAYPVLPPTTAFPPIKLDRGLYYVNAFEPFISTMETETIAARNVVDLLLHDEFGKGICPPSDGSHDDEDGFVLGWDC